jgi:hypothetical protein
MHPTPLPCANCRTPLLGAYCHACGEKQLHAEKDFSIVHFVTQLWKHLTQLDSKFLRSFWLLFAKPGFLTAEYVGGRQKRYLKPFVLFLTAGVVFYFALPNTSAYYLNYDELYESYKNKDFITNTFQFDIRSQILAKAAAKQMKPTAVLQAMYAKATNYSKTWLLLVAPIWAIVIFLLFKKKNKYYIPHLIFAIHSFTAFILIDLLYLKIMFGSGWQSLSDVMLIPFFVLFAIYLVIAVRRFYQENRWVALAKSMLLVLALLILLAFYRQIITIVALSRV